MTTTTTELQLTFKSSAGKKNLNFASALPNLTADQVKAAASAIAGEKLFVKEGEILYDAPLSAKYIERNVTTVFDDSNH